MSSHMPEMSMQERHVRLFRNGRNQAVRIPVEFELPGDEAIMHKEGDKLIIEPYRKASGVKELLAQWRKEPPLAPEDQFPEDIDAGLLPLKDIEL